MKTFCDVNNPTVRTYSSLANLEKGVDRLKLGNIPCIPVRNAEGRWTAIFTKGAIDNAGENCYAYIANCGFHVVA